MTTAFPLPPFRDRFWAALTAWIALAFLVVAVLAGCSTSPKVPPPAVEVLVPVAQPCAVAQVTPATLPSAHRPASGDIFEDVKTILADRATLKADRERLLGANSNPCPE